MNSSTHRQLSPIAPSPEVDSDGTDDEFHLDDVNERLSSSGWPNPLSRHRRPTLPKKFTLSSTMEYVRQFLASLKRRRLEQEYQPINGGPPHHGVRRTKRASTFAYTVFVLLGLAMLWAWNCFLAAAAYFEKRFATEPWIFSHFQSSILASFTVPNLCVALALTKKQRGANYAFRITSALMANMVVFVFMALLTVLWTKTMPPKVYFALLITCVVATAFSTGSIQNGLLALGNSFGRDYIQGIMVGQAIAGVLPPLAQIITVAVVNESDGGDGTKASPKSAFVYFLTATAVAGISLCAFHLLQYRHKKIARKILDEDAAAVAALSDEGLDASQILEDDSNRPNYSGRSRGSEDVPLTVLLKKLRWHVFTLVFTFAITMFYPVFTSAIVSVRPESDSYRIFHKPLFIPFSIMIWNFGDLAGRLLCGYPRFAIVNRPKLIAFLAVCRLAFIPLFLCCNIRGRGATINSDVFYWAVLIGYGLSNGWLSACTMMSAPDYCEEGEERETAGGFMGLALVAGLAIGSVFAFFVVHV